MDALIASFCMVAIAEIGDKTQLLSFVLATRFRGKALAIIAGIFVATVFNHALAATAGDIVARYVSADVLRWVLGLSFLAFAVWALIPDKLDEDEGGARKPSKYGAFATTTALFFLAEMGDKTQLATVALGAKYSSLVLVAIGTTLGMMAANVPAVLIGERLGQKFPLAKMRFVAAVLFAVFGALILLDLDIGLGLGDL
jgi:putative Ca2+/H+ antiporter (TMEM165/GDT1 family)